MSWSVPLTELELTAEDLAAVEACLRSGWLTMGPRTGAFEAALAEWTGAGAAVAVSSGTAALHLACRALDLGPGDEVVVPAFTFLATAHAPRYCGATPVLCDVAAPEMPLAGVAEVERAITPRTRAVMAVHFWGYAADAEALRELCADRGLALIEDTAQAIGARVPGSERQAGTVGDAGCLSFFSKKQLPIGEGGAVLSDRPEIAERVALLRSHAMTSGTWDRHRGYEQSYDVVDLGYNFRIDEPRAALGHSRLRRLADELDRRRAAVERYRSGLAGIPGVTVPFGDDDVRRGSHFAFAVLFDDGVAREQARESLAAAGIQTTRYPALHTLTEYAPLAVPGTLPAAEAVADRHLALPLHAHLRERDVDEVIAAVRQAAQSLGSSRGRIASNSRIAAS
jgi:dTDP-4-amino-4,6-dideoxygalactose transaminase